MRIIISAIHYPVASGRYMAAAFRRQGHEVRTLGDSTGNRIPWPSGKEDGTWADWTELDPRYAWQSDGSLTTHWPDWTPDLIVHMDSAFAYHHPVYADVPHVVYGVDNHVRDYRQAGIARYFLAHKNVSVFTAQFDDPVEMVTAGHANYRLGIDAEHLPCGYDPVFFTPSPIPWAQREYDICMIGVLYPQRIALLNALASAGLKVLAGTGWVYEQYRNAYWNARISLCSSANGDLAQRVFETAAMGCAILTDPLADLQDRETNKKLGLIGYVTYGSADECVAQARELLSNEEIEHAPIADGEEVVMQLAGGKGMGEFAAMKMLESVWGRHSWDRRAERICEWWEREYGISQSSSLIAEESGTLLAGRNNTGSIESDLDRPATYNENSTETEASLADHEETQTEGESETVYAVGDMSDPEAHEGGPELIGKPVEKKRKRKRGQ